VFFGIFVFVGSGTQFVGLGVIVGVMLAVSVTSIIAEMVIVGGALGVEVVLGVEVTGFRPMVGVGEGSSTSTEIPVIGTFIFTTSPSFA
jgi:hypothetical protein